MYTATSAEGPWSGPTTVTVSGHDAKGLVDPAPILMPDGSILLYYLMDYQTTGDPALTQPGNVWKYGVARGSGASFAHQGVAFQSTSSMADPAPLLIDSNGTIRLFGWSPGGASGMFSVTATDGSGTHFGGRDAGLVVTGSGKPGALKIGSTYYLYFNGSYVTSNDGLNFTLGSGGAGPTGSPVAVGNGTYLMAYICSPAPPNAQRSCISSSTDGRTWTRVGEIGLGGVPGMVRDASGTLRVYVVLF